MSTEVAQQIAHYGYLAIFLLILLQELGVPNPVTNEFVLLFSGYLAFTGVLNLKLVFLTSVAADCIGTTILYVIFYRFGSYIVAHRPRWFPISPESIASLSKMISERRQWGIYLGRLIPFLRGYASVAAGLLGIRPAVFIPAVVISAITWTGGYVIAGRLLGPYWQEVANKIGQFEGIALVAILLIAATFLTRHLMRRAKRGP